MGAFNNNMAEAQQQIQLIQSYDDLKLENQSLRKEKQLLLKEHNKNVRVHLTEADKDIVLYQNIDE